MATPTCRACGRPLPNNTYGERCEDCYASSRYHPCCAPSPGFSNIIKLGLAAVGRGDRRRCDPHSTPSQES